MKLEQVMNLLQFCLVLLLIPHVCMSQRASGLLFCQIYLGRVGQEFQELHTRHFYKGSGLWKSLSGQQRSDAIDIFIDWFAERKHHVVFSAVDKKQFKNLKSLSKIPCEI